MKNGQKRGWWLAHVEALGRSYRPHAQATLRNEAAIMESWCCSMVSGTMEAARPCTCEAAGFAVQHAK